MEKKPVFEIHLEEFNHALHIDGGGHKSDVSWLLQLLEDNHITPQIYMLEDWNAESNAYGNTLKWRYKVKSHGIHHYYDEKADRSPYFNQEGIPFPPSGGFFFRLLPIWYLKWAIKKSGIFWLHPHDLDEDHPKLKNPLMNWKRHVGLKHARNKLEKLIKEIKWENP